MPLPLLLPLPLTLLIEEAHTTARRTVFVKKQHTYNIQQPLPQPHKRRTIDVDVVNIATTYNHNHKRRATLLREEAHSQQHYPTPASPFLLAY